MTSAHYTECNGVDSPLNPAIFMQKSTKKGKRFRPNHNEVEKKRRMLQTQRIHALKNVIPSLQANKTSTISIVSKAKEYIDHLTKRIHHLEALLLSNKGSLPAYPPVSIADQGHRMTPPIFTPSGTHFISDSSMTSQTHLSRLPVNGHHRQEETSLSQSLRPTTKNTGQYTFNLRSMAPASTLWDVPPPFLLHPNDLCLQSMKPPTAPTSSDTVKREEPLEKVTFNFTPGPPMHFRVLYTPPSSTSTNTHHHVQTATYPVELPHRSFQSSPTMHSPAQSDSVTFQRSSVVPTCSPTSLLSTAPTISPAPSSCFSADLCFPPNNVHKGNTVPFSPALHASCSYQSPIDHVPFSLVHLL